jgi:hypothetical protein
MLGVMHTKHRIAVVASLLVAACGSSSPRTSEPVNRGGATSAADAVSDALDMLEQVAAAIVDGASCADKGNALRGWLDGSAEQRTRVSGGLRSFPGDEVMAEVENQMKGRPTVQELFRTAASCDDDPTFSAAWSEAAAAFDVR